MGDDPAFASDQKRGHLALVAALVARVYGDAADAPGITVQIAGAADALRTLLDASRAAWPGVDLDDAAFVARIGETLGAAPSSLAAALAALHGPDLYLATACARGDAKAMGALDRHFLADIPSAVGKMRLSKSSVDDLVQVVRQKLLLGNEDGRPKIADFAGRGPLDSWVRVVAVRAALSLLRKRTHEILPGDDALMDARGTAHNPELDLIRARHKDSFKGAFQAALQALSPEDRTTLRLHFVEGLNIDQIGSIYRVHRATIARRIARSREALLEDVRRRLSDTLRLSPQEFDSLVGVIRSQFEVSLERLLEPQE